MLAPYCAAFRVCRSSSLLALKPAMRLINTGQAFGIVCLLNLYRFACLGHRNAMAIRVYSFGREPSHRYVSKAVRVGTRDTSLRSLWVSANLERYHARFSSTTATKIDSYNIPTIRGIRTLA